MRTRTVMTRRRMMMRRRRRIGRRRMTRRTRVRAVSVLWVVHSFLECLVLVSLFLRSSYIYFFLGLAYNFHSLVPSHLDLLVGVTGPASLHAVLLGAG